MSPAFVGYLILPNAHIPILQPLTLLLSLLDFRDNKSVQDKPALSRDDPILLLFSQQYYLDNAVIRCTNVAVPGIIGIQLRRCGARIIKVAISVKFSLGESKVKN